MIAGSKFIKLFCMADDLSSMILILLVLYNDVRMYA